MATSEAIMTKTYQFLLFMLPLPAKLSRDQKSLVADRYETKVLDMLELYVSAYYSSEEDKPVTRVRISLGVQDLQLLFPAC